MNRIFCFFTTASIIASYTFALSIDSRVSTHVNFIIFEETIYGQALIGIDYLNKVPEIKWKYFLLLTNTEVKILSIVYLMKYTKRFFHKSQGDYHSCIDLTPGILSPYHVIDNVPICPIKPQDGFSFIIFQEIKDSCLRGVCINQFQIYLLIDIIGVHKYKQALRSMFLATVKS